MDEAALSAAAGEEAYLVGGAIRDELLGRPVLDVDVACREPEAAARAYAEAQGGAVVPLSERHGAWRVAYRDGRTVDFTPLQGGIEDDLATRDFTVNAIARRLGSGEHDRSARRRPGPRVAHAARRLRRGLPRRSAPAASRRAPRGRARPADRSRDRGAGAPRRLARRSARRRADPRGAPAAHGRRAFAGPASWDCSRSWAARRTASTRSTPRITRTTCSSCASARRCGRSRSRTTRSGSPRRCSPAPPPADASPRSIHRFRRVTEPWALEVLAYLRAGEYADAVREARDRDPAEPLLRGDELGLEPGPEIGRLLELVEEERAAGTISTPGGGARVRPRGAETPVLMRVCAAA